VTTFIASKYDPDNDPHKPNVGDPIPAAAGGGTVGRVEVVTGPEFITRITDPGPDPFDVAKDHPERPFVKYLVWRAK